MKALCCESSSCESSSCRAQSPTSQLPLQARDCALAVEHGVELLPCLPFQRLQVEAPDMTIMDAIYMYIERNYPFWQRINLHLDWVEVWRVEALILLLESHPADQLVVQGPRMDVLFDEDEDRVAAAAAEAMLRSRITS